MSTDQTKRKPVFTTIDQVRPDTSGHNLRVKRPHPSLGDVRFQQKYGVEQVVDAKLVLDRPGRANGAPVRLSECLVGDETGIIVFTARNTQVDLMQPGNYVILRNAKVDMFKGSMRLVVNQWGKIEEAPELDFEVEVDNNLSLVEYELVQVPTEVSSS